MAFYWPHADGMKGGEFLQVLKHKADLMQSTFPNQLQWDHDNSKESLQKVYQFVVEECDIAINWYHSNKFPMRKRGYLIRSGSVFLIGISAIIPALSEIFKGNYFLGISPMWATVAVIIGGTLIGFDRFGGWTNSWIRFTQTAQALAQLKTDFQIDWEKFKLALIRDNPNVAVEHGLEKCRLFAETVHLRISLETDLWAQEFQKALTEIEGRSKPK
jgi:hypothetical protein